MYHAVWDIQYNSGLSAEGGSEMCLFNAVNMFLGH